MQKFLYTKKDNREALLYSSLLFACFQTKYCLLGYWIRRICPCIVNRVFFLKISWQRGTLFSTSWIIHMFAQGTPCFRKASGTCSINSKSDTRLYTLSPELCFCCSSRQKKPHKYPLLWMIIAFSPRSSSDWNVRLLDVYKTQKSYFLLIQVTGWLVCWIIISQMTFL